MHRLFWIWLFLSPALGCRSKGTDPPPTGWANSAPTQVAQVVERGDQQLLRVQQNRLETWIQVPAVGAKVGDHVLLGQGTARNDVEIPELGERVAMVVDIAHIQVTDAETAARVAGGTRPDKALEIGAVYADLDTLDGQSVVVHGTVVKATSAVGSVWVHLQDGTGDPAAKTHDLTVQSQQMVSEGQRVSFEGVLRKDADLGFGYHYDALVEDAKLLEDAL